MIPWAAFRKSAQEPDWRVELNAENVYYYVEHGPSQHKRALDSPMLGLAHERQFAISQLGTRSVGFEKQHIALMQEALRQLSNHFTMHSTHEACRPTSPHSDYLTDCRHLVDNYNPLPPLDSLDEPCSEPSTPSPVTVSQRSSRSPLALQELMNPLPLTPSSLKRKSPDDLPSSILADDVLEAIPDLDDDALSQRHSLKYSRAGEIRGTSGASRTRRNVRMRLRSCQRQGSLHDPLETEQFEKEGQLLLHLARSPRTVGNET
ncbi:hypothetical protein Z517_02072 [Fonsecaea pedrosoi CBS 271.37]|uniref:Unplaced genomic scaffold supercont1.2, whole genome shotgun sequence n=1 Tax=Fonsecaea pedrosoi CBS 271.37 TaxID=1442368 RepID=A0A0D2HEC7_9EURO|nr:uncharacterized protein Z517_02072 [Fonsecaea pedrosoi CBS 271.37]KIW82829.1 hypothetical protein Z517_02072 [Fonsecaea pedrosoi CBS 271.37]